MALALTARAVDGVDTVMPDGRDASAGLDVAHEVTLMVRVQDAASRDSTRSASAGESTPPGSAATCGVAAHATAKVAGYVSVTCSVDSAPAALVTTTDTTGKPGADASTDGALHCTTDGDSTTTSPHTSPPMCTTGGARVVVFMNPVPVTTTGVPTAATEVGVMEVSTGRVTNAAHASHANTGAARLAHTADAFSVTVGVPACSTPAAAAAAAFHAMHTTTSVRPARQPRPPHGSPPTEADDSRGTPLAAHTPAPGSRILTLWLAVAGSSVTSGGTLVNAGAPNRDGSTPVTLNSPASCTMTGMSTPSADGMVHDSVVDDSHAGAVHGAPASHTARPSIVACAGGCRPTATQSAVVSRGWGMRRVTRPPVPPGARGDSEVAPPGATTTAGGGRSVSEALSGWARPPVPLCTTHSCVRTGAVATPGSRKGSAQDTVFGDTAATAPHDTLAPPPAGTR